MKRIFFISALFIIVPVIISNAQITPQEAVLQMQKGINMGNTLEPPDGEGTWGNPPVQEYYFDVYKAAGFNCVRIPVTWDKHTGSTSPYTIDASWLARVTQIIDWGLARGLYIVVNAHHESWIKANYTNAAYRARFDSIWSQISVRLKGRSAKLFFEILNEPWVDPQGLTKAQNNELNARILSIIRKTNPKRIVIFQGHNYGGSDELIQAAIPNDSFLLGSFHSYDPYPFGLVGTGTFGQVDVTALTNKFTAVKNWSIANNVAVFMGEFGAMKGCEYNARMKDYATYVLLAQKNGFVYCAWEDGGDFRLLDRSARKWSEIKDILIHTTASSPKNLVLSLYHDTTIQVSWANGKTDYDTIYVQRRTASGNYVNAAAIPGDSTSFLDVNLPRNASYYYRLIARYNSGDSLYSYPQGILLPPYVAKVRTPFPGSPAPIPGIVEAENFDIGGEGFTYHDLDVNNIGGAYRKADGVDIYKRNDGGYQIGNIMPGEWMEYTINIANEADYSIYSYVSATQAGGTFNLKIGNVESETLTAQATGNLLTMKKISTILHLPSGVQIMRFTDLTDPTYDLDKFVFSVATSINTTDIEEKMINIFQNTNHEWLVNASAAFELKSIRVYNVCGSLIQTIQYPESYQIINTSGMPRGLYIVKATGRTQEYSSKLIVN